MADRPEGVTKEEWDIYLKVAAITGALSAKKRKPYTKEHMSNMAKIRWEKHRQAREAE